MGQTDFSLPEGTHTIVMGLGDANGIMRGKRIPAGHWDNICKSGNAYSVALFAIDMTCDVWDTPYVNFDNGYPDFHMFPLTKPVASPWEEGVAYCFARAEGMDHKPVPIDPRNALIAQVERAAAMGYTINVGAELEFYLLDPETMKPRDKGIDVYGLGRAAEMEHVLGPIRQYIDACGIPLEQSNPEYAAGQVEVNIRYGEALESADRVVMFRSLVKQLAIAHGYHATFMAKPFFEESGNGFHVHHSLWKDGKNVFADGGKLSALGMHYLGGLQSKMVEASITTATTPNAYRRIQPYSFSPINNTWGGDNRTVGLRVIEGSDSAVRIEQRNAAADCNPYLLMAAQIAAGLDGIEQGLPPSAKEEGNGYENTSADPLPTDLATAVALAKESDWLKGVMGEMVHEFQMQQADRELEFFAQQVTQVEIDRYMTSF
ncbi:MAG: glutamine synthetase family protein [Pseudomonadota bacterium]